MSARAFLFIFPFVIAAGVAAPGEYQAITSPSGKFVAKFGIAGAEASPSVRLRVRLVFERSSGKRIGEVWTGYQHWWVVLWSDNDVLLAYGRNEETTGAPIQCEAYDFTQPEMPERSPTASERARAAAAYERKYGSPKQSPNQRPEPTSGAVTPRAGARVAPAPAAAHP